MTPQAKILPVDVPQKTENGWAIAMPKEIAEKLFGLPEDSLVIFQVHAGGITAQLDLAAQTAEARQREPGWFVKMPVEMARSAGVPEGSTLGLYAKAGRPYVETYPPLDGELKEFMREILTNRRADFEEMKRRGD